MDTAVCAPADPDAPRWGDWLLGDQPEQRLWLARLLRVGALFLAFDLARALGVGLGHVPLEDMAALLAYDLGVLGVGYGLIRSGWSARLDDPAMTMPLVALALVSIVLAYVWISGAARCCPWPPSCWCMACTGSRPARQCCAPGRCWWCSLVPPP